MLAGVLTPLVVLLCWSGATRPADGHVLLSQAIPEPGSSSRGAPRQVQLQFTVPAVTDPRTQVAVLAPSGRDIATGEAAVSGLGVSQALAPTGELGWFRVRYRAVIWGGHVDSGEFRFLVERDEQGVPLGTVLEGAGGVVTLGALALVGRARRRAARSSAVAS